MGPPGTNPGCAPKSATADAQTSALADLELVCGDLFDRWDKDMRAGKLLTALSGLMAPGYDPRVDRIRAALAKVEAR